MLPGRTPVNPVGKTRICPHCKSTILDSATVCPGCKHHLQFNPGQSLARTVAGVNALTIEGTVRHPVNEPSWEYSLVIAVRNERGEEIQREVISVGALHPGEARSVTLSMDVFKGR